MSIDALSSVSDSSDDIDLQLLSHDARRDAESHPQLQRVLDESRSIIDLVSKKAESALAVCIQNQGGPRSIWQGLNQSGYKSFTELCEDIKKSVTAVHAKLIARENHNSGDVSISQEELTQTIYRLLSEAFMDHGQHLKEKLDNLKTYRTG